MEQEKAKIFGKELHAELISFIEIIPSCEYHQTLSILNRVQQIQDISKGTDNTYLFLNLIEQIEVFKISERIILYLLFRFKKELLPEDKRVKDIVNSGERNIGFTQLAEEYPFAIRSTDNSHLYLTQLKQLSIVFNLKKNSLSQMWYHEMGHFARRLQINKEITRPIKFMIILQRNQDDILGFQPGIAIDDTNLSFWESIQITIADLDDLSNGDKSAIYDEILKKPFRQLKNKIKILLTGKN